MRDGKLFVNPPRLPVEEVGLREVKGMLTRKTRPQILASNRARKIQLHFTLMYFQLEHIGYWSSTSTGLTSPCATTTKVKAILTSIPPYPIQSSRPFCSRQMSSSFSLHNIRCPSDLLGDMFAAPLTSGPCNINTTSLYRILSEREEALDIDEPGTWRSSHDLTSRWLQFWFRPKIQNTLEKYYRSKILIRD